MTRLLATGVVLALLLPAGAQPPGEKQKIEALIKHVAELKDAKFVRNNIEYDAATAARFLRGKWDANAARIKSAGDFIEKVASASSTSGKAYLIRFKDGKEVKSGDYLRGVLRKLETDGAQKKSHPDVSQPNFLRLHKGITRKNAKAVLGEEGKFWFRFSGSYCLTWTQENRTILLEFAEVGDRAISGTLQSGGQVLERLRERPVDQERPFVK